MARPGEIGSSLSSSSDFPGRSDDRIERERAKSAKSVEFVAGPVISSRRKRLVVCVGAGPRDDSGAKRLDDAAWVSHSGLRLQLFEDQRMIGVFSLGRREHAVCVS